MTSKDAAGVRVVLFAVIAGFAFQGPARAAENLLASDFGQCPVTVDHPAHSNRTGAFTGVLPTGWEDNFSGWSRSQASSCIVTEEGRRFLRLTTTKLDSGAPQFNANLPALVNGAYYRVTLRARNRAAGPLSLGVRMGPPPYRYLFEKQLPPAAAWVEKSWCFKLEHPTREPLGLYLVSAGLGTVDIARIRFEPISAAEMAATIPRPDPATRNFFRNSRLPLGLQAGWNLGRDGADATAEADPSCVGPSGAPALRLATTNELALYSEPFQVANPQVKNQVALAFRGTGSWRIGVVQEGRVIAQKHLTTREAWQRASLAFAPDFAAHAFALQIVGRGTLWVDAFDAGSGEAERPYESAGACEVALALPDSEIDETRIQFADEAAQARYRVTGDAAGATLTLRVVNVYGVAHDLPDIRLTPERLAGSIAYDVFKGTPYGAFRIEACVTRDGQRCSPWNELVVTRLQRPRYWGRDAPASPFGCHFISVDRTITMMKAGGVNWARLHDAGFEYVGWWWLEPEPGQWAFRDDAIARYRSRNIKIYAQFGTAPKWASYLSKVDTGRAYYSYHDHYFQPLSLPAFSNYVSTVVSRYRGVIDEYFVWNEPWIHAWWPVAYDKSRTDGYITSARPQADFAALMRSAYAAAKAADPTVQVAGFNTTGGGSGRDWTRGVYDAGGMAACDRIDYHFYTTPAQGYPGSTADEVYRDALGYVIEREGPLAKPVYMSEGQGTSSGTAAPGGAPGGTGLYRYALPYASEEDALQIADLTAKYVLSLLANRVSKVFLYTAHGYQHLGAPCEFNVLLCGDGYPHPSLAAHANLARLLEERSFVKVVALTGDVYAYLFAGGGRTVAVISGKPGSNAYALPRVKGATIVDLFGNPLPAGTAYTGTLLFVESKRSPDELAKALGGG